MLGENNVRLFCTDLDGTLLGDSDECDRFSKAWENHVVDRPFLVYSTGRLDGDAKRVIHEHKMPQPDYYISGVGTMIFDTNSETMLSSFSELLNEGWDLAEVTKLVSKISGIRRQPEEQQHPWKSSWFWKERSAEEIEDLRGSLKEAGLSAQIIYSTSLDLDVLPLAANKGNALQWLAKELGVRLDEIVVAGDSGNDSSMFKVPSVRGIAPSNSSPELLREIENSPVFRAKGSRTSGVIEGLSHYGVFVS
ncbi:MAG: HAD-IIB family hydrolase [Akkermansiaceae bacterium]